MADETASPGIDQAALDRIINQLTSGQQLAPQPLPDSGPSSREGRGWLSLLGEGLGGGAQYGSTQEREQGGLSALQAAGLRMMQASDWSYQPHTFGSILAAGGLGARQSLGQSQAVASARQQAAYDQARQAQQDQLARLKEAIPLLELKGKLAAVSALPATLDGDSGGGAGTYEGAIGGHEGTGKNPNSTAYGTGQFLASTWNEFAAANPDLFKGMTPEQILAARSNPELGNKAINWLAQRNAGELTSAGVAPSGQSLGMAHYLGSGPAAAIMKAADNAPVSQFVSAAAVKANPELGRMTVGDMKRRYANTPAPSFLRTAQPAPASPPGAPPPGRMATPTPTRQPDPGSGNIPLPPGAAPPPSDTAGPATTEPPIAPGAGAQVAGPGAPTAPGVAPTMPGTDADVALIREGMVRSGANPDTLAPGPVPGMGGTPAAGPAAPPEPAPGSFEAYKRLHAAELEPDPATAALFRKTPNADQLADIEAQRRSLRQQYLDARRSAQVTGDQTQVNAIRAKDNDLKTQANTLRENAEKLGVETERAWREKQNDRLFQAWTAETKLANDRADQAQKVKDQIEVERQKSEFNLEQEGARSAFKMDEARGVKMGEAAANAGPVADQLRQLQAVLPGLPEQGPMAALLAADSRFAPLLSAAGAINPQTATNFQLFDAITNHLQSQLRVSGSGTTSDKDLATYRAALPGLLQTKAGRAIATSFLLNIYDRIGAEHDFAQEYYRRKGPDGKTAYNFDGLRAALLAPKDYDPKTGVNRGGLGPVIPHAPPVEGMSFDDMKGWIGNNVEIGHPYMGWGYPQDRNGNAQPTDPRTGKPNPLVPKIMVREQ